MLTKEEIIEYFITQNHTRKDSANHFGVDEAKFRRICKKLGIEKPRSLFTKNIDLSCAISGKTKYIKNGKVSYFIEGEQPEGYEKAKELFIKISKQDLYEDFINKNMTRVEVANKYDTTEEDIRLHLEFYSIKKSHNLANKRVQEQLDTKYNSFTESIKRVNKEELEEYFIHLGHSREECCEHFDVTINNIKKIINVYELNSPDKNDSHPNKHFAYLLDDNGISYEREFRLGNYRFDFKIGNTLVEINPTATHNATFSLYNNAPLDRMYHCNKSAIAEQNGFRCIHVFDWDNEFTIANLLISRDSIAARKCEVKDVPKNEAIDFINNNHIQGYAKDSIRIGLYYNSLLVSIMTFGKPRYNKNYEYELIRYCSTYNVIGGAERLFKHFVDSYKPSSVISYCDKSKFSGDTYVKLGFTKQGNSKPSLHWYNVSTKQHITDNLLRLRGFDLLFGTNYGKGTSNEDLMLQNGFVKVYDCGQDTFVYGSNSQSL